MVLKGKTANKIVFKLVGKTISLQGFNQNIAFIDGGNTFDEYTFSGHFSRLWKKGQFRERVYVSRAFTYPQLAYLIKYKLPNVLISHSAGMVVVSDITLLFSDPDIKNKGEALGVFRSCIRFLAGLARENDALFIVTVLESRDWRMDSILTEYECVFARVK